ncbi:predicted protein [Histoplasma capsulatum H143]|uniref:Uncharacterized protein n=1 Tax=Ajellomyces capsulatus (strain H143) TaxID=544712 RepID=C6HR47_AJECH|nr:predicted protein [Histoplasma capsulatum H143]
MACIFQSLPPKVLERRFGAITSWPFSGVCLNVVPPIYQRLGLAPTTRQEFKLRSSAALIIPSRGVSLLFQRPLSSIELRLLRNGHGEIVRNGSKTTRSIERYADTAVKDTVLKRMGLVYHACTIIVSPGEQVDAITIAGRTFPSVLWTQVTRTLKWVLKLALTLAVPSKWFHAQGVMIFLLVGGFCVTTKISNWEEAEYYPASAPYGTAMRAHILINWMSGRNRGGDRDKIK